LASLLDRATLGMMDRSTGAWSVPGDGSTLHDATWCMTSRATYHRSRRAALRTPRAPVVLSQRVCVNPGARGCMLRNASSPTRPQASSPWTRVADSRSSAWARPAGGVGYRSTAQSGTQLKSPVSSRSPGGPLPSAGSRTSARYACCCARAFGQYVLMTQQPCCGVVARLRGCKA
jgi:hypothetical protein